LDSSVPAPASAVGIQFDNRVINFPKEGQKGTEGMNTNSIQEQPSVRPIRLHAAFRLLTNFPQKQTALPGETKQKYYQTNPFAAEIETSTSTTYVKTVSNHSQKRTHLNGFGSLWVSKPSRKTAPKTTKNHKSLDFNILQLKIAATNPFPSWR
jgi:hypothetical protein